VNLLLKLWTNVQSFNLRLSRTKMARVWSIARVTREGEEVGTSETAPISEMMRRSGLIVQDEKEINPPKDVADDEVEPTTAEADSEDEDDDDILNPSKRSHI
jgi:hypothetical protein